MAPDVIVRLDRIAALLGLPRATVATLAIGQYVTQQENAIRMLDGMANAIGGIAGQQIREQFAEQLKVLESGEE
jgi:predicted transcriptional regulator